MRHALVFALLITVSCSPSGGVMPVDGAPSVDLGAGYGTGEYVVPADTTLTPFLSVGPMRGFDAAGVALMDGRDYFAVLETDVGRIVIDLLEVETPLAVNSFVWLARHHFFDGLAFHRVISGFVAQGGDPNTLDADTNTWGLGGPGYQFGTEPSPTLNFDGAGAVGMARTSDPNSNGSQFYITLAPTPSLNGMYTLFGHVTLGLDVLPRIARGQPPAAPTRMLRVYIADKAR